MATGFHGIHVMLGVIFLLAAVVRLIDGTTKADRHFGYLSAIWY
jgi:cytochrome c oxidase subunit 3